MAMQIERPLNSLLAQKVKVKNTNFHTYTGWSFFVCIYTVRKIYTIENISIILIMIQCNMSPDEIDIDTCS